jgi:hypothetical protein
MRVNHRGPVDALEQAPYQSEAAVATQIVGQLLDNKIHRVSHLRFFHLQGETQMRLKCLICIGIYPQLERELTDSDFI